MSGQPATGHGDAHEFDAEKHHYEHLKRHKQFTWWLQAQQKNESDAYHSGLEAIANDASKLNSTEGRAAFVKGVMDKYWAILEKKGVKKPANKLDQDVYIHGLAGITEEKLKAAVDELKDNYLLQAHRAQTQEHTKYLINNHLPRLLTPELQADLKKDGKKADQAREYALKLLGREGDLEDKTISALEALSSIEESYQGDTGPKIMEQHYKKLDKKYGHADHSHGHHKKAA